MGRQDPIPSHSRWTPTLRYQVQRCDKKSYTYNLPKCLAKQQANPENQVGVIYCRVSSTKQLYPKHQVFRDICNGLKYKRPGLSRLLDRVREGIVKEVVVAHKDRLTRFGTELIEWIIQKAGGSRCDIRR